MKDSIVDNAADEKQLEEGKEKVVHAKNRDRNSLKALLSLKDFRRFIYPYIERCDRISADPSGSWTYFKEGERNICQKIKSALIEADDEGVLLMMKEGKVDFK